MAESSNNPVDALLGLIQAQLLDVNTCIPATIVEYADGVAKVTPSVKKRFADGDVLDYPIIPNVRVCWPSFSGGLAGMKGPVNPGDRCLLVFAQQAIDGTDDRRMFDLQDAYAVMCDLGRAGKGDSDNNDDMTLFFGSAHIRISSSGGISIYAPGGYSVESPSVDITASETYSMTTGVSTRMTMAEGDLSLSSPENLTIYANGYEVRARHILTYNDTSESHNFDE